jgi:hypothetical protein
MANWEFLPDSVNPYFCIKVAILGMESTIKHIGNRFGRALWLRTGVGSSKRDS